MQDLENSFFQDIMKLLKPELLEMVKNECEKHNQENTQSQEKDLMTRDEVADYYSISLSTLPNWEKSGRLKPIRAGRRVLYKREDVLSLIN